MIVQQMREPVRLYMESDQVHDMERKVRRVPRHRGRALRSHARGRKLPVTALELATYVSGLLSQGIVGLAKGERHGQTRAVDGG